MERQRRRFVVVGKERLNAAVAQLVEYLLAKQDVTSSNLVSRSRIGGNFRSR